MSPTPHRVLVVEDDPDMANIMKIQIEVGLAALEPTVEIADTIRGATVRLTSGPAPDVVVLDLGLPDSPVDPDRLGALRLLLTINNVPPIVVVTANITDPGERALAVGASEYLHKVQAASGPHLVNAVCRVIAPATN